MITYERQKHNIKFFARPLGYAVLVIANLFALGFANWLLNNRSDISVAFGFVVIVVAGCADAFLLRRYIVRFFGLALCALSLVGCYKTIEPGHAGIKVEQTGSNKGVSQIPVETGRVFYTPWNEYVLSYPTNVQRAIWTASPNEGQRNKDDKSSDNEEISFQSSDQLHFTCDVAVAYQLVHEKVPAFYIQFRSDDIANFTHGFFRDAVRKAIGLAAQRYTQEEINGGKQADLESEAQKSLAAAMEPYGVRIIQLAFTAPPRPPQSVKGAIEGKIAATQRAEQIENEKRQAVAEGQKNIAYAEAQAKANALITSSITPTLIQWEQLKVMQNKWDGHMPMVQGSSSGLILTLPK